MLIVTDDQPDPAALSTTLLDSDKDDRGLLRIATHDERASFVSNVTSPVPSISCFQSESSCNAIEARMFWRPDDAEPALALIPEAVPTEGAIPPDSNVPDQAYTRPPTPPLIAALRDRFANPKNNYTHLPPRALAEPAFLPGFTQRPSTIRVSLVQPPTLLLPPEPTQTHRRSLSSSASAAAVSQWVSKTGARVAHAVMGVGHSRGPSLSFDNNDLSLPLYLSPTSPSSPRTPSHPSSPQRSHPSTPLLSAGFGSQPTTTATTPATLLSPLPVASDPVYISTDQPFVLGPPPPSKKRRSRTRSPSGIARDGNVNTGRDLIHPKPRRSFPQPLLPSIMTAEDNEDNQAYRECESHHEMRRSSIISAFFRSLSPVPSVGHVFDEESSDLASSPRRPYSTTLVPTTPPHLPQLPRPTSLRTPPLTHFLHARTLADDTSTLSTSHTKLFTSTRGSIPTSCSSPTDYADTSLGDTTFTTASMHGMTIQLPLGDISEFGVKAMGRHGDTAPKTVPEAIAASRRKTVRIITPSTTTPTHPSPISHDTAPPLPTSQPAPDSPSQTASGWFSFRGSPSSQPGNIQGASESRPTSLSRTFFLLGFLLGPWCFLIGALLVPGLAPSQTYPHATVPARGTRIENESARDPDAHVSQRRGPTSPSPALEHPQQPQARRRFGVFPFFFSYSPHNLKRPTRLLTQLSRRAVAHSQQSAQPEARKWIIRCRIAAASSGVLIMTAFIASIVIVASR